MHSYGKGRSRSLSVPSGESFDVFMASFHEIVLPSLLTPPEGKELRKDQEMYNDLIGKHVSIMHCLNTCTYHIILVGQLRTMGVGWKHCSI